MIRLIFVALFVVLFLIIGIPVLGIEWLIGKVSKKTMDYSSLRLVQWAFSMMIKLAGIELTVIGEENISEGPVLYIGNHRSFFDIVITYARCKNLTGYIAKKEMLSIPLLRTWMKRLYCLFLDRENPKEGLKTILQAIDYVKHGIFLLASSRKAPGIKGSNYPYFCSITVPLRLQKRPAVRSYRWS